MGLLFAVAMLVVAGGGVLIAEAAGVLWWCGKNEGTRQVAPPPPQQPRGIGDILRLDYEAGRWPELLRYLDRTLPKWPVAASLIEAAREIAILHEDVARARRNGVSEEVTGRLEVQARAVADDLWSLAERIAAADRLGSPRLREELAAQDDALVRLFGAMREAREGLAELSLSDIAEWEDLRRAEGQFGALAATARELHAWERERVPW